jgi:TonB-linked SusC/RagA family outer membrane protein
MEVDFYKQRQGRRRARLLALFMMLVVNAGMVFAANDITVSGKVTSAEDGTALPGVNVYVKGTQSGTMTDVEGRYTLSVANGEAVVIFSYIGFTTQEVVVGDRTTLDVTLLPNSESLDEVVVTALGIKREERSLGYSVGKVNGEDLSRIPQENVLNGLAGRVPGVAISSTGGPGSSVSMIIRGAKSLSSDNQPLFVVDGVPVASGLNNIGGFGSDNRVDYGNAISDINTDNIESVSVLKGASATALYGSRAGNGVVLITTKSGSRAKRMTINVSSNNAFDIPYKFLPFHSKFAIGVRPYTPDNNPSGVLTIDEESVAGNGPELDKGYKAIQWNSPLDENGNPIPTALVSHPDNVKDFVQTGITSTNSISIANSTEQLNYNIAYTNMSNRGIIPNSDLFRNSLDLSTGVQLNPKVKVTTNLNFTRSNSNNRPANNRGANPIQWAYYVSPHIDINDLRNYWVKGQEGLQQLTQDNGAGEYNNPYFLAYEVNNSFVRDRVYGNVKAEWQISNAFSLMGRYSMDTYREQRESKIANSYTGEPKGAYGVVNMDRFERNADFLLTYKKDFAPWHVTASIGGNTMYQKSGNVSTSSKSGAGLITPGIYTVQNIAVDNLDYSNYFGEKGIYSAYGLVNLGYKDMVYLDLTARNDWSSTLPKGDNSYFYPSASLSVLMNEMLPMPEQVSMLKLRGAVAQVGNDTGPYQLINIMNTASAWEGTPRVTRPADLLTPALKPEISTSTEVGAEFGLLNNRIRFEGTYYTTDNKNQIILTDMAPSSGFERQKINAGLLQSRGWEFSLGGTPVQKGNLRWDVSVNYSRNRTKIVELPEELKFYSFWSDGRAEVRTYVGETIGDIYDSKMVTVEDKTSPYYGYPLLSDEGTWQVIRSSNVKNKIGNFNPDFTMGLQTTVAYRAFTLNMSFDWRKGGDFISQTYRYAESDLKTQRFLDLLINPGNRTGQELRDWLVANQGSLITDGINIVGGPTAAYGGQPLEPGDGVTLNDGVFNPGVIAQYDGDGNIIGYTENLGGEGTKYVPYADNYPWDFMGAAMFDASFIKLREISLAYQLPAPLVQSIGIRNASLSIYARNIMLWTAAKIGVDPELAFQPESGAQGNNIQFKQGIERYNVNPWTISTGFKLSLTF